MVSRNRIMEHLMAALVPLKLGAEVISGIY